MEKNVLVVGLIALIVGAGGGYIAAANKAPQPLTAAGGHMMPNGSMMGESADNGMQTQMDSMMAGLTGKTGDAFDQAFLSEMTMHHQGAIQMAQLALQNAQHQEIKDLAQNIIKAQTSEIKQMQDWKSAWYGQ